MEVPFKFRINEGVLVFQDIVNYEIAVNFLSSLGGDKLPYWEDKFSYVSMRKAFNAEQLEKIGFDDEVFASLVNPEGYIQIADYLFKVNMVEEIVEAIKTKGEIDFEYFAKTQDRLTFNTADNIFAILDESFDKVRQKSSCASSNTGWKYFDTSDGRVQYRVRYYKAGIYFTLRALIEKESGSGGYVDMYMRTWSHWTFARRNSSNCIMFAGHTGGSGKSYSMRAWSNMYSLSAYAFFVDFTINDMASNSQNTFNLGISCNSHNDCSQ